jgi:mannose-6-phosphate isomerase-like protein (cupin superfamily)
LYFVISGELSLQLAEHELTVDAGTLVRVPKGTQHYAWNQGHDDAVYLEIVAPALPWQELAMEASPGPPLDLARLVQKDARSKSEVSKSGFDYKFLANRALGSDHVAINIATVQPGHQGPDYHIHTFDQFYFVLHGWLAIDVGFERFEAGPLSLVALPAGIIHRQRNEGREAEEHLSIITPEPAPNRRLDHQIAMPRLEA